MIFTAYGHKNILANHKTTIEFTKDSFVTETGDCILGVNADFSLEEIKAWTKGKNKVKVTLEVDGIKEELEGEVNQEFNDNKEIVFRMGVHKSPRTLITNATKSAKYLNRTLVEKMKVENNKMTVTLQFL